MQRKIRDMERRSIRDALEEVNSSDWEKIASEIDYERNQIYFWFLVDSYSKVEKAVSKVVKTIRPYVLEREGVQFNVSFIELSDNYKIDWETIDDESLRSGKIGRPAGSNPWRSARSKYSVFDRPDYFVLPADEPA